MAGEVVHDHDVARLQIGDEDLADIGLEPVAVDWAVQHHGNHNAVEPQSGNEGRRLAMAVRVPHAQPFTTSAATVAAHHVRGRPGFVDEDEACWIEIGLGCKPRLALAHDVGPALLDCVTGFFFRVRL